MFAQYMKASYVPSATRTTLDQAFPKAQYPAWRSISVYPGDVQKYEATFVEDDIRTWVTIDVLGNLFSVERKLEDDSIPEFARTYASANYKFKKINESRRIYLSDRILILVILKGNRLYRSILFSNDGDLIADKSNVSGYVFSIFGASIIPDIGIFKPFKLNDSMVGPSSFDYRNVGK